MVEVHKTDKTKRKPFVEAVDAPSRLRLLSKELPSVDPLNSSLSGLLLTNNFTGIPKNESSRAAANRSYRKGHTHGTKGSASTDVAC